MREIIGIDPGVKKSGLCVYDKENELYKTTFSLSYPELIEFLRNYKEDTLFLIENSNLDRRNWHGATARGNVAKNKAISQSIVDMAKYYKLRYKELSPCGYSNFFKNVKRFVAKTGYTKKTNEHERAAAAMIFLYLKNVEYGIKFKKN